MPLGQGLTAEEQITGQAVHGGLQIIVYPMKAEIYERDYMRPEAKELCRNLGELNSLLGMGLAPGGRMKQEIYKDSYGFDVWDRDHSSRCFVTILDAVSWHAITGEVPPTKPITAKSYAKRGIPWFDFYDADQKELEGTRELQGLIGLGSMVPPEDIFADWDKDEFTDWDNVELADWDKDEFPAEGKVISLGPNKRPVRPTHTVREESF